MTDRPVPSSPADAPRRALILVDVQQDYFDGVLEIRHPAPADSLPVILAAIDAATAAGIPIVAVQHDGGVGSPIFDPSTPGFALHPEIEARRTADWMIVVKPFGSVYAGTGLAEQLRERGVDTVALVGYMTNNCILASSVEAEGLGLTTEVLRDATGAIHLANAAGAVDARTVHETLMVILHSNLAAVATAADWADALATGTVLSRSNLVESALAGADAAS
ncbi:isochorismatase family protein [Brachybacterium sp. DNPG3]